MSSGFTPGRKDRTLASPQLTSLAGQVVGLVFLSQLHLITSTGAKHHPCPHSNIVRGTKRRFGGCEGANPTPQNPGNSPRTEQWGLDPGIQSENQVDFNFPVHPWVEAWLEVRALEATRWPGATALRHFGGTGQILENGSSRI